MTTKMMSTVASQAQFAVDELTDEFEQALDALELFCEKFYWIKDHEDFQRAVRDTLVRHGRTPVPYGH